MYLGFAFQKVNLIKDEVFTDENMMNSKYLVRHGNSPGLYDLVSFFRGGLKTLSDLNYIHLNCIGMFVASVLFMDVKQVKFSYDQTKIHLDSG